jgi:enoyl-CoA hydratase
MNSSETTEGTDIPTSPYVVVTQKGAALWARINRPDRANACGTEVLQELEEWLDRAATDSTIRAVVLTGTGAAFCAGADVREGTTQGPNPDQLLRIISRGRDFVASFANFPKPTIAALNGAAFAGGFELVQAADLVIAVRGVRLGDRHIRYGILPGWGASARLPRLIGPKAASLLLLTGIDFEAEHPALRGLISEIVAADDLEPAVDRLVASLSGLNEGTATRMLKLTRAGLDVGIDVALDAEWTLLSDEVRSPDFIDRLQSFFHRGRTP